MLYILADDPARLYQSLERVALITRYLNLKVAPHLRLSILMFWICYCEAISILQAWEKIWLLRCKSLNFAPILPRSRPLCLVVLLVQLAMRSLIWTCFSFPVSVNLGCNFINSHTQWPTSKTAIQLFDLIELRLRVWSRLGVRSSRIGLGK